MSEEELIKLLNRFFGAGFELSISTYIYAALISFISAFCGGYFSSYFKKSGEIKAITDRLEETVSQLKRQTKAVEEVKADISNRSWIEQQKWEFRKAIYVELIDILLEIRNECIKAEKFLNKIPSPSEFEEDEDWELRKDSLFTEAEKIYNGKVSHLTEQLKKLLNQKGMLFLSNEVISVLREYFNAEEIRREKIYKKFEQELAEGQASVYDFGSIDTYEQSLYHKSEAAEKAYVMLIRVAKSDLKINS